MSKQKCGGCGYFTETNKWVLGRCSRCQTYIIEHSKNETQKHHDKWCSQESERYQEKIDEYKKLVKDFELDKLGSEIALIIKKIAKS